MKLMLAGLVWQFLLSMFILYRKEGTIRISILRRRFWLNNRFHQEQVKKITDYGG